MTLYRPDVRAQLFLRVPALGGKREADEIEPDGIIDHVSFLRSEAAPGDFTGAVVYRPNVALDDQLREAGLVDGAKLMQTGLDWADIIDLDYELYYLLHPYVVNECIRLAHNELWGEVTVPLTLWPDGDFAEAGVAHWDNGDISSPTKSQDRAFKYIGNLRTLVVLTSGGNLYSESDIAYVEPGEKIFHGAIGCLAPSSTSGTLRYQLWDETNGVALYTNEFSSYRDQIVRTVTVIPNGCYKITARIGTTANGITTHWKGMPSHRIGSGTTEVQPWLKEQMNLLGFGPVSYGASTGDDRYNAHNRTWTQWSDENGKDYQLMPFVPASTQYTLQINRQGGLGDHDYWIHGYRRMSEIEDSLDNETAYSDFDEEMLMTAAECLVTAKLGEEYKEQYIACRAKLDMQRIVRAIVQVKRETGVVHIGLRG